MTEYSNNIKPKPLAFTNWKIGFVKNEYSGRMERTHTFFDKKGRLKKEIVEDESGSITVYKYNKNENVIKEKYDANGDGKPDMVIKVKYDKNGNFIDTKTRELHPENLQEE